MSKKAKLSDLIPDDRNANKHSEYGMQRLEKGLRENGLGRSILISSDNKIIAGNGVTETAGSIGIENLRIIETDGKEVIAVRRTDIKSGTKQFYNMALSDNIIAKENIVMDAETVDAICEEYEIEEWKSDDQVAEAVEDDFDGVAPKEPITVLGDLYEIGEHRLLCGDSTCSDTVARLMNGEKADMVFTDPPYRVSFEGQRISNTSKNGVRIHGHKGANTKYDEIENDSLRESDFTDFMAGVLGNLFINNKGAWYICFAYSELHLLLNSLVDAGYKWKNIIIWMKNQATLSNMDYKSRYEPIVYGQPGGSFYGERYKQEDIWEFQRTLKNDLHPTMKPIPLIENALNNSSRISDTVLDLFLGSGSTMVASEQLNRKCYGMELDPKYCDVIVSRMMKLDDSIPIKRNGVLLTKDEREKYLTNTEAK